MHPNPQTDTSGWAGTYDGVFSVSTLPAFTSRGYTQGVDLFIRPMTDITLLDYATTKIAWVVSPAGDNSDPGAVVSANVDIVRDFVSAGAWSVCSAGAPSTRLKNEAQGVSSCLQAGGCLREHVH